MAKIAKDLGISESCLRRWMDVDDVDAGRKEGLTTTERRELVLINTMGSYAGTVIVPEGTQLLAIGCDGNWSLTQ